MGHFSMEKSLNPGSDLGGNQQSMRKSARAVVAALALLLAAAVLVPRGPMGHGWDWPWHDWYHSSWERSRLHKYDGETQMPGLAEDPAVSDTITIRST